MFYIFNKNIERSWKKLCADWTGRLVGEMHTHKVTNKMLAECMGVTDRYVSMVLHGHRSPADAEHRFRAAFEKLLQERGELMVITKPPDCSDGSVS